MLNMKALMNNETVVRDNEVIVNGFTFKLSDDEAMKVITIINGMLSDTTPATTPVSSKSANDIDDKKKADKVAEKKRYEPRNPMTVVYEAVKSDNGKYCLTYKAYSGNSTHPCKLSSKVGNHFMINYRGRLIKSELESKDLDKKTALISFTDNDGNKVSYSRPVFKTKKECEDVVKTLKSTWTLEELLKEYYA